MSGARSVGADAEASDGDPDWRDEAGSPIGCREKLRVLADNHAELATVMRDAWEDAVLMGVDPAQVRAELHRMVDQLRSPKRP